jgi:hypothetical protein
MAQRVAALSSKRELTRLRQQKRWVKAIRWVIPGSRLFKTCFGRNRAVTKVARPLCHVPKRLPSSISNLAVARCNSDLAQYSNTPSLRVAGFEDEDDDEDETEAPCEFVGPSFAFPTL